MTNVKFLALGGLDEDGKNLYLLEINDEIFIINCGTKTPATSTHGIDTIMADFSYLESQKHRIKGLFITDIKNESFSGIPWLLMKLPTIPIYSSIFSKYLIKERISKYKLKQNLIKVDSIPNDGLNFKDGLNISSIPLAGALPGTIGLNFKTKDGSYIFLSNFVNGDLNFYGKTDLESIAKNNKIIALLMDSGMVNFNGKSIDHINIKKDLKEQFDKAKDNERIIVAGYDQEMSTLHQIIELARENNRTLVVYGRAYSQLLDLLVKANKGNLKMPQISDYKNIKNIKQKVVILVTGNFDRLYKRLKRIASLDDVYLKFKSNDHFIMVAPPNNGLEVEATEALNDIAKITPNISDIAQSTFYRCHPAKQDLIDIVNVLNPTYFIPIQGLFRYLALSREVVGQNTKMNQNNILVLQNGKIAQFEGDKLISQKTRISQIDDLIIDGIGVGDVSKEVIYEREVIARDGSIIISAILNKKTKELYDNIDIAYIGVISHEERESFNSLIKNIVAEIYYKNIEEDPKISHTNLQNFIKRAVRKKIFNLINKEPMVAISFNEY